MLDRYRVLVRKKYLYDSIDDEEYKDEEIDYYISPNSLYIKIFDISLFLSSIFYLIIIPYFNQKIYLFQKIYFHGILYKLFHFKIYYSSIF